jgi:pyrroloquinoline quinone (PQQ) biosynthesis protein C
LGQTSQQTASDNSFLDTWQRLAEAAGVSFAEWVIAALERAEKRER